MTDDAALLSRFARERDDAAFTELVRRHLDFVYAIALRQAQGNAALAQDVTQQVFIDLARKAGRLARHAALAGWLHTATRFAAAKAIRSEVRRAQREREAEAWQAADPAANWQQLQPVIDDALGALKERERTALLLRFFAGQRLAEVGASLALSEDAARSCIDRALEKLRGELARRGITSTGAALGLALAQQPATAAPAAWAATVATTAVGASAGGAGVAGAIFAMSKIKLGVAAAAVLAVAVPTAVELQAQRALRAELAALQTGPRDLAALRREADTQTVALRAFVANHAEADELLRLRARAAQLQRRPEGVVDAELKPRAAWRNVGWATPEAALESGMWASTLGNTEEFVSRCRWLGEAKEKADAAFAQLSEVIRARYGSADRLFGEYCFGSRTPENDAVMQKNYGTVVAFQVLDATPDPKRGGIALRYWEELATGEGRVQRNTFVRIGDEYGFGESRWNENSWQEMIAQIDPVTGAFRPRVLVPLDPATGRPRR